MNSKWDKEHLDLLALEESCVDLKNRRLYFIGEEISDAETLVAQIHYLNSSAHHPDTYKNPIYIIINSPGGSDDMTFCLYDAIVTSEAEIVTIGTGMVCSAASLILCCGDRRYATENCWFMTHKGQQVCVGDDDEIEAQAELSKKVSDRYWKLLGRHTTISGQRWYNKSKGEGELWLEVEGMLQHGVIDAILHPLRRVLEPLPTRRIKTAVVLDEHDEEEEETENDDD